MKLVTKFALLAAVLMTAETATADPRSIASGAGAMHTQRSLGQTRPMTNTDMVIRPQSQTTTFSVSIDAPASVSYTTPRQDTVTLHTTTQATVTVDATTATVASR